MHRFYIPQKNIEQSRVEITDSSIRHQMEHVLRLRVGDQLEVFSDDGIERVVEIRLIDKGSIVGRIVESRVQACLNPTYSITLYLVLLKKDKFEWVLQKGTEIGIDRFVPLITEHAVKDIREIPLRWKKILQEATEQSGGVKIPEILEPMKLKDAIASVGVAPARPLQSTHLFFTPSAQEIFSEDFFQKVPDKIGIWIGPEGGFSEDEIELAKAAGFQLVSFGEKILRAETAAIVYPAIVRYELSKHS